jgi:hypothetical protein
MNSSAFEKVLLSAILTSCTVFSVLMVAFIPRRPEPITIEPLDRLESTENINQRDVMIRHIGMSIVVSVGAGITTAELIRKWGRSREARLEGQQGFSAQAMLQAVAPNFAPDLALPGDGFTASLGGITEPAGTADRLEFHKPAVSVLAPDRSAESEQPDLPLFLFQPSAPLQSEDINWFQPLQPDASVEASAELRLQGEEWRPTLQAVLASRGQYQTCRISVPELAERVLAILFDGQHYRFIKLVGDREQAFRLAVRLDQRGEPAVITDMDERYAVWALEPAASPEPRVLIGAAV